MSWNPNLEMKNKDLHLIQHDFCMYKTETRFIQLSFHKDTQTKEGYQNPQCVDHSV